MSEDRLTCPHLGLDTRFPVHGPPRVVLDSIAAGGVDCEVCRRLLAFDDLLATLRTIADKPWSDRWMFEVQDTARAAIAKAEGRTP